MNTTDTIVALATARGIGALAVIRVSGEQAIQIVKNCIAEKERFETAPERNVRLYTFTDKKNGEPMDRITAIQYHAPRSYTGEDMVEILCHGGDVTAERILESLTDCGARYAGRGEFTRRAFSNGKTSLTKAESINRIINSGSTPAQRGAIYNYLGGCETLIQSWKEDVEEIVMEVEAAIEFSEDTETDKGDVETRIKKRVERLKKSIIQEMQKRKYLKEIENGVDVAIVGPVNAGKSSLFNLIMGYERSIVDTGEGTTRDFISEQRKIDDIPVRFIDTAGIRNVSKSVEKKGIEKSWEFINRSKVLLWVSAANEKATDEEIKLNANDQQKIIGIINKIDLADRAEKVKLFKDKKIPYLEISAIDIKEREGVEDFIVSQINDIYKGIEYDCIIGNKRQEKIMEEILHDIEGIEKNNKKEEIIAEHGKNIIRELEEYVGKITSEELLNRIFNEFCIGK